MIDRRTQYRDAWGESLSAVMAQISGEAWEATPVAPPAQAEQESFVRVEFQLSKGLSGITRLCLPESDALGLAALMMGEAPQAIWSSEGRETLEELLRQVAGYVASRMKTEYGEVCLETRPPSDSAFPCEPFFVRVQSSKSAALVRLEIDEELRSHLVVQETRTADPPPPEVRNLDLLMDVELAVTLRFGERVMPLRDILQLQSGSVIELDRGVQEPVDLLLNGAVIARGSVVVVDGAYGLRVLEVAHAAAGALS